MDSLPLAALRLGGCILVYVSPVGMMPERTVDVVIRKDTSKIDGRFVGVGVAVGVAIGAAMDNLALSICLGLTIGVVVGRLKADRRSGN